MSSNLQVERICQFCDNSFIAKTTVTKYCSLKCSSRVNKQKVRNLKVAKSNQEVLKVRSMPTSHLKEKEFLTVKEVGLLLGFSTKTVYRILTDRKIHCHKISDRKTRVRRADIDALFEQEEPAYEIVLRPVERKKVQTRIEDCYHIGEIQEKFNISSAALYNLLKRLGIEKFTSGKFTYVAKRDIEAIL